MVDQRVAIFGQDLNFLSRMDHDKISAAVFLDAHLRSGLDLGNKDWLRHNVVAPLLSFVVS